MKQIYLRKLIPLFLAMMLLVIGCREQSLQDEVPPEFAPDQGEVPADGTTNQEVFIPVIESEGTGQEVPDLVPTDGAGAVPPTTDGDGMDAQQMQEAQQAQEAQSAPVADPAAVQPNPNEPIYHLVRPRDTLGAIAESYNVSIDEIMAANGMVNNVIIAGDSILIPQAGAAAPAPVDTAQQPAEQPSGATNANGEIVVYVQSGQTLGGIANDYGFTSAEVAAYNGLTSPDSLFIGQEIRIPPNQ